MDLPDAFHRVNDFSRGTDYNHPASSFSKAGAVSGGLLVKRDGRSGPFSDSRGMRFLADSPDMRRLHQRPQRESRPGVAWLSLAMVLLTAGDAIARYVFHTGAVAVQELEWHLFAVLFLPGAGYTFLHDGHVRVDIVYSRLQDRWKVSAGLFCCRFVPGGKA